MFYTDILLANSESNHKMAMARYNTKQTKSHPSHEACTQFNQTVPHITQFHEP